MKKFNFNFGDFKATLLNDEEKCKIVNDYESHYENLNADFKDTFVFKSYLDRFEIPNDILDKLNVPLVISEYFDIELLLQLAFASFSSSCNFKRHRNGKLDLLIKVTNSRTFKFNKSTSIKSFKDYLICNYKDRYPIKTDFKNLLSNQTVPLDTVLQDEVTYEIVDGIERNLNDLWSFQVQRLFEIYTEEQLNLFVLIKNEPAEADAICNNQRLRYERFKINLLSKIDKPVCMTTTSNILDL